MDIASIGGIALAIIGILAGMMIEGGSIAQITQPTAAMIVFGGTLGAVMLQFPMNIFLAALKAVIKIFLHKSSNGEATLSQIVRFANKARRSGIVSLDADLATIADPFLRQALMLAVDGTEPAKYVRSCNSNSTINPRSKRRSLQYSKPQAATLPPSASSELYSASSRS